MPFRFSPKERLFKNIPKLKIILNILYNRIEVLSENINMFIKSSHKIYIIGEIFVKASKLRLFMFIK